MQEVYFPSVYNAQPQALAEPRDWECQPICIVTRFVELRLTCIRPYHPLSDQKSVHGPAVDVSYYTGIRIVLYNYFTTHACSAPPPPSHTAKGAPAPYYEAHRLCHLGDTTYTIG